MISAATCSPLLAGDWTWDEGTSGAIPYVIATGTGAEDGLYARWDEYAPDNVHCAVSMTEMGQVVAESHGMGTDAEDALAHARDRARELDGVGR